MKGRDEGLAVGVGVLVVGGEGVHIIGLVCSGGVPKLLIVHVCIV